MLKNTRLLFAVIFGIVSFFGVGLSNTLTSSSVYAQDLTARQYWEVTVTYKESPNSSEKRQRFGVYARTEQEAINEAIRQFNDKKISSWIFIKAVAQFKN